MLQYQGQEYDVIFLDEATQFTEYQFHTLTACIRGANPFPKRMYLTCNPGGVGQDVYKRQDMGLLYQVFILNIIAILQIQLKLMKM